MMALNDSNFEGMVGDGLAVVMFAAPWAGPCNIIRPDVEELASRYGNQIRFGEFNLDDNPETPQKYGVKRVPLFLFMKDGVPQRAIAGAIPADNLKDAVEELLDA